MLQLFLIGNLGADAQEKENNGKRFLAMNVAHTEKYKDVESTYWVSVTLNHYSEKLIPYLKKGTKICAIGRMTTRVYRGNDGQQKVGINLMADTLELCTIVRDDDTPANTTQQTKTTKSKNEDDSPF